MTEPMADTADAALAERARDGDTAAFDALLQRHYDVVFAVAMARLHDRGAVEDLAQEVFLRAWLNIAGLRDGAKFGPWVARMARNLSVNWLRAGMRRSRLVRMVPMDTHHDERIADAHPDARESAEAERRSRAPERALAKLSPAERELVVLHFMESVSHRDIADRLGVNHTTVGRRIGKSLGKMRETLAKADVPKPRPEAKAAALSVVLAAATMSAGAKSALVSAATAAAPKQSLDLAATILVEGVKAMSLAKKIGAVAVVLACAGGGAVLLDGDVTREAAASSASPAAAQAAGGVPVAQVYRSGTECSFDVATGQSIELAFSDELMEMESATLSAPGDGTVVIRSVRLDGDESNEVFAATAPGLPTPDGQTSVHIQPERGVFAVSTFMVRRTATGVRVSIFTKNRPELLAQAQGIEAAYAEGRGSKPQVRTAMLELVSRNDMLPQDPELRSVATTWIKTRFGG